MEEDSGECSIDAAGCGKAFLFKNNDDFDGHYKHEHQPGKQKSYISEEEEVEHTPFGNEIEIEWGRCTKCIHDCCGQGEWV